MKATGIVRRIEAHGINTLKTKIITAKILIKHA